MNRLKPHEIARACAALPEHALQHADTLNDAMERFFILDTERRVAAFLATVAVESAYLSATEENLNYRSAERLVKIYPRAFKTIEQAQPYTRNPEGLSQKLYAGYHGRGLVQLSWRENYERAGDALGYDYVGAPTLVTQPKHAALTAAWFWHEHGCNELADDGDMDEITRRVNGPARLHLEERTKLAKNALGWLYEVA